MEVLPRWIVRTALSTSDALCANLTFRQTDRHDHHAHPSNQSAKLFMPSLRRGVSIGKSSGRQQRDCVPSLDLNLYNEETPCEHRQTYLYGEEVHLYFGRRSLVEHIGDDTKNTHVKPSSLHIKQEEDEKGEETIIVFDKYNHDEDLNTNFLNDNHPICFDKMWEKLDPSLSGCSSDSNDDSDSTTAAARSKPPIPQEIIIDFSMDSPSGIHTPPKIKRRSFKESRKSQPSKVTLLQAPRPLSRTDPRKSLDSQQRDGDFLIHLNTSTSTASTSTSSTSGPSVVSSLGTSSAFFARIKHEDDESRNDSVIPEPEDDSLLEDLDKLLVNHKRHDDSNTTRPNRCYPRALTRCAPMVSTGGEESCCGPEDLAEGDDDEELRFVEERMTKQDFQDTRTPPDRLSATIDAQENADYTYRATSP